MKQFCGSVMGAFSKFVLVPVLVLVIAGFFYMQQPQFGNAPEGERLRRIQGSRNYKDGKFRNRVEKPTFSKGYNFAGQLFRAIFQKYPAKQPVGVIPSVRTELRSLPENRNWLVWFGHSSVLMGLNGTTVLVDPVFSGKASPLPWGPTAYPGSDAYAADDMPEIDYLLISHDHYDHLDYDTVVKLSRKVKHVVCGLGVGTHFEKWGYAPQQITEVDWGDRVDAGNGVTIYAEPAHHKSGRGLIQNKTLWLAFLIKAREKSFYISGDGGYDGRFREVAQKFGPVDWAIMENGQYDRAWQSVHNLPGDVVQATLDLEAGNLLPVHHSKFTLAKHPWSEPLTRIVALSVSRAYRLATPRIGEVVLLDNEHQLFTKWWEGIN